MRTAVIGEDVLQRLVKDLVSHHKNKFRGDERYLYVSVSFTFLNYALSHIYIWPCSVNSRRCCVEINGVSKNKEQGQKWVGDVLLVSVLCVYMYAFLAQILFRLGSATSLLECFPCR